MQRVSKGKLHCPLPSPLPGWQRAASGSLPLHIWKGSVRKRHAGHFPPAHLGIESSASLCWDREGFAGVIIPSWPGVLGKQKLLPCQREGWLEQPLEMRAGLLSGLVKATFWCLNLALDLNFADMRPSGEPAAPASINTSFCHAVHQASTLPSLRAQPPSLQPRQ